MKDPVSPPDEPIGREKQDGTGGERYRSFTRHESVTVRRNLRCGMVFEPGTLQMGVITLGKDAVGSKEVIETTRRE